MKPSHTSFAWQKYFFQILRLLENKESIYQIMYFFTLNCNSNKNMSSVLYICITASTHVNMPASSRFSTDVRKGLTNSVTLRD